ncbi:MAG: hypothetical protein P1V97_30845, partial [Planctomycetota bacterium]|nr:hypothetical protein [Planctomycetota bacterium]
MTQSPWTRFILLSVLCMSLCSCKAEVAVPKSLTKLQASSKLEQARAEKAYKEKSLSEANKAKEMALGIRVMAKLLIPEPDKDPKEKVIFDEIMNCCQQTILKATLTEEEHRLNKLVNGWQGKIYGKARNLVIKNAFLASAKAAEQAAERDLKVMPESVQNLAKRGCGLLASLGGPDGEAPNLNPDWVKVAKTLKDNAEDQPTSFHVSLALGYTLSVHQKLALIELELVDISKLSEDELFRYRFFHGLLLSFNDFPELAALELNELAKAEGQQQISKEALAVLHLALAAHCFKSLQIERGERNLTRAMRLWPNNPLAVFVTGEKLAANGDVEKAAISLETVAKNTKAEWLANLLTKRARTLRDSGGEASALVSDSTFLRDVAQGLLDDPSRRTETTKK